MDFCQPKLFGSSAPVFESQSHGSDSQPGCIFDTIASKKNILPPQQGSNGHIRFKVKN